MEKGEIRIVKLPESGGREQYGTRPVIIVSDTDDDIAIIIPFTTNFQSLQFPNTIEIEPSDQNGLEAASVALVFQIRAIDERRIHRKIGVLEKSHLKSVDEKIRDILQV